MSPYPDLPSTLLTRPTAAVDPVHRPYERPARAGRLGRWRPLCELALFLLLALLFLGAFGMLAVTAAAFTLIDGGSEPHPLLGIAACFGAVAVLLPAVALTVRWAGGRTIGSVSSTAGRLRRRWMCSCVPPALVLVGLLAGVFLAQAPAWDAAAWPGWGTYAVLAAGALLVVPLQAAAEEYLTRGWLVQAFAVWTRFRWLAAAPGVLLFVAGHGTTDPWAVADLTVFAVACCWLTFRTGGLEAAIVLHVVNNVLAVLVLGLQGVPAMDGELPELTALDVLPGILVSVLYAWWIARRAARHLAPDWATAAPDGGLIWSGRVDAPRGVADKIVAFNPVSEGQLRDRL